MEGDVVSAPTTIHPSSVLGYRGASRRDFWEQDDTVVNEILDNTTIEDLVNLAKREGMMDAPDSPEYYI